MRYYVYTAAGALMEVRRNDAGDHERFVARLTEAFPTAIYFEVAP